MSEITEVSDNVGVDVKAQRPGPPEYCLMTAAYNEEENIARTIESVLSQTLLPKCWVIVSDGSVDRTDEIVKSYAEKHQLIRLLRVDRQPGRSFGRKVKALHAGGQLLENVSFDFIGNLDADVSVQPPFFEDLISRLQATPLLGIAGGYVCEQTNGEFRSRRSNRAYSVAHAAQLLRRECYDAIGGYAVLEYGGEDWHAQISAQIKGWTVAAFPDLQIFHHRRTGEADNLVRHKFRQGRMDYSFGSNALFETLKCLQRIPERPVFIGSAARLIGFFWSYIRKDARPVSDEFVAYLRKEQRKKMVTF